MKNKSIGLKVGIGFLCLLCSPFVFPKRYFEYVNKNLADIWRSSREIHPIQFMLEIIAIGVIVILLFLPCYFDFIYHSLSYIISGEENGNEEGD